MFPKMSLIMKGTSWSIMNDGNQAMLELGLTSSSNVGTKCASVEFPTVLSLLRGVESGAIPLDGTPLQLTPKPVEDRSEEMREAVLMYLRCAVEVSPDDGASEQLPTRELLLEKGLKRRTITLAQKLLEERGLITTTKQLGTRCVRAEYPTLADLLRGVETGHITFGVLRFS